MHACVVCSTWESDGELGSEAVCEAWVQVKVLGCQVPLVHPWEEVFCKQYVITSHPLIPYRMNVTVINGYPTICIHYNTLPWFKYSPKTFVMVRHSSAVLVILMVAENTFSHMSAAQWRELQQELNSKCNIKCNGGLDPLNNCHVYHIWFIPSCDVEWRENTEVCPSCCSVRGQLQREERS